MPISTGAEKVYPMEYRTRTWQRAEFTHRVRCRRRISRELDRICGIEPVHLEVVEVEMRKPPDPDVDYWGAATGMNLGIPQQRALCGIVSGRWAS